MDSLSWITEFNILAKLLGDDIDCYGGSKNVEEAGAHTNEEKMSNCHDTWWEKRSKCSQKWDC